MDEICKFIYTKWADAWSYLLKEIKCEPNIHHQLRQAKWSNCSNACGWLAVKPFCLSIHDTLNVLCKFDSSYLNILIHAKYSFFIGQATQQSGQAVGLVIERPDLTPRV